YISLLGLISMLATLFTFIGGYFSDRMNRIALLKIVVLIRILNTSFGLVIYLLINNPILGVMMTVVINSVLNIVYSPLTESIVPSIVHDRDDLVTANSWVSITNQLASVLSA
ncbi:MFS transporter, partial [Paenibacillus polymyxa]|nr:MFS transporter [Paenibacillus polymyxa]